MNERETDPPAEVQPTRADATAAFRALAEIYGVPDIERDGIPAGALETGLIAHGIFTGERPPALTREDKGCTHPEDEPCFGRGLEGGTGPGVLADQTRERPDIIPPALTVHVNRCSTTDPHHTECLTNWERETLAAAERQDPEAEFRPCGDCRTPITCEESGEDRCP